MLCGPLCKVFLSPNREEYHRLRLKERKSYKELSTIASEKEEEISAMSFHRHFRKHVSPLETYKGSNEEEEWLEKKARERFDVVKEIEDLLILCKSKLEEALKLPTNAQNITAAARIISEVRATLQYIQQHKMDYFGGEKLTEEASLSKLIEIIDQEIPEEFKPRILARLQEEID